MTGYTDVSGVETYRGEQYRLIRRDIWTPTRDKGITRVWIWVILTGPGTGMDGGKCRLKAEARAAARSLIRGLAEEAKARV